MRPSVHLGWSAEEMRAYVVAEHSIHLHSQRAVDVRRLCRLSLSLHYTRPTITMPNGKLWDQISDAPMSTDHAIARFFVPFLEGYEGWSLFTDGDILVRRDIRELFALADDRYAVQVVQHPPFTVRQEGLKKGGGHVQMAYPRKNWSSVILWNCGHPAHRALTLGELNSLTGRELHRFCWLQDEEIGALPAEWNYLVGITDPPPANPALVHYTLGTPDVAAEPQPYADEWLTLARSAGYADLRVPA